MKIMAVFDCHAAVSWVINTEEEYTFPEQMKPLWEKEGKGEEILQAAEPSVYVGIKTNGKAALLIPIVRWKKGKYHPYWCEVSFETESRMGKELSLKKVLAWRKIDFTNQMYQTLKGKVQ